MGLDGAERTLEVLEALEEAREHGVAVVGEVQVALGLDAGRRDREGFVHPQEVGDIGVARKGLAPVGVAVNVQLADNLFGGVVSVVDHQVAAQQQVVQAHVVLLASAARGRSRIVIFSL